MNVYRGKWGKEINFFLPQGLLNKSGMDVELEETTHLSLWFPILQNQSIKEQGVKLSK